MSDKEQALVVQPKASVALARPAAPADIIEYHKIVIDLIQKVLEEGRDFGVVPGTKGKPSLYKAGAERVLLAFGDTPTYTIVESEHDHNFEVKWTKRFWNKKKNGWDENRGTSLGLYRYVVRCDLIRRATGEIVGSQTGTCSTMESKYVDRPRDCENTVLKMAQKRAMVGAALNAYGLSDRFTQDMEDNPGDDIVDAEVVEPKPEPAPRDAATEDGLKAIKQIADKLNVSKEDRARLAREHGLDTRNPTPEAIKAVFAALQLLEQPAEDAK